MAQLEIKPTGFMRLRVAGIFVLAVCLTIVFVYLLTGGGSEIFEAWSTIYTYLPDATGITPNTPVRLSGIQIGKVTGVRVSGRLDKQRAVAVEMSVKKRYLKNIPMDSTTDIGADTLIGDKFVDINEGKSEAPLPDSGVLESEPLKQATDRADLILAIEDDLRQINSLVATMSDPNTRLGHFIVGEEEYDIVLERVKQFDHAMRGIVAPDSPIAEVLFTNKLYDQLRAGAARLDQTLESIEHGEKAAGQLFVSDKQYDELTNSVRGIRDTLARFGSGQGKAGTLLGSDASYLKLAYALKKTNDSLSRLESGQGRTGELMRSAQFYESLNGTLRSLADLLRDFHENPQKYMHYQVFGKKKKVK